MRTKKNCNLRGGSYNDKVRVTRSCTKYASRPLKGNYSKCKCTTTGDEFKYNNQLFECTETGFSLLDSSDVSAKYAKLLEKILEFDETYQQFENREEYIKTVNDFINKEYRVLGLDIETKNFIREYILDDFKYRRRFKGEVGTKNVEILLKNLDKIKRKILKKKNSKTTFTLQHLKEELKQVIKVLENHISQVNKLMKEDELGRQIKGDPFDFSDTKIDLNDLLIRIKTGEITLSKQDLAEKINDAFESVISDVTDILEKYTESAAIKKAIIIRLNRDFGDNNESKKRFYFKYTSSRETLKIFSIKFIRSVLDSEGADNYKKFINRTKLIEFMRLLVKYDSNFKDGSEKGINKYFEGLSLSDIVSKIQSYTTLDNLLTREKSVIQSSAGLQFSDYSNNKNDSGKNRDLVNKLIDIVTEINKTDAKILSDTVRDSGTNSDFIKKNKIRNNKESIKTYLTKFFTSIHNDSSRLDRRIEMLKKLS